MRVEKKRGAISICTAERCYCKRNSERQVGVEKEERRPLLLGKVPREMVGLRMKEAHPALQ